MNEIEKLVEEHIEPFNYDANLSYDGTEETWCSDFVIFPNRTKFTKSIWICSHVKFFRPVALIVHVPMDWNNFCIYDVYTSQIIKFIGNSFEIDEKIFKWIDHNKINIYEYWLRENTILPPTRKLGEVYHYDNI